MHALYNENHHVSHTFVVVPRRYGDVSAASGHQVMVATGRIAAEHGSFHRIHQVAPTHTLT